jgi:chitin disaccharide deacetylase
MAGRRLLIVNADDFGQTTGVNTGIIGAHERGIVTCASLMVRGRAAQEAARYARARPQLGLGLHLDLGEWAYRDGAWEPLYEVVRLDDHGAVREEISRQLERFRGLAGRDPTHLDSHQHVHRREPVRAAALELARALDVPLRGFTPGIRYRGEFYGQTEKGTPLPDATAVASLVGLLGRLEPGTTELGCHPGEANGSQDVYAVERAHELEALCHPAVADAIDQEGIRLVSFAEAARLS